MTAVGDLITPTGRLVLPPDQLGGDAWLEARRWRAPETPGVWSDGLRIGSSDVPSILDLPEVDTPAHVYRNKVYSIERAPTETMRWGNLLEPVIALEWCRRNRAVIDEIGIVARDGAPWHQSTIDRRVRQCPLDRADECLLEVKKVGAQAARSWKRDMPDRILAQLIHQLYVTGYGHAHYAVLVAGEDWIQGVVRAEKETRLTEFVVEKVDAFRREHLIPGVEPAWNLDKPAKMLELDNATHPQRSGIVELDINGIGVVQDYLSAAEDESAAKKRKARLAAELRQLAGGAEIATFSNERAYWYRMQSKPKVDLAMLKERWPDAYDAVVSEPEHPVLAIDNEFKKGRR